MLQIFPIEAHVCRYKDNEPCFDLCLAIQRYYERHSCTTRMKVAGLLSVGQAIRLAGSSSMTIAPTLLRELSETQETEADLTSRSLFQGETNTQDQGAEHISFINDEVKYRAAFAKSISGKGTAKTAQVRDTHLPMIASREC